MEQKIEQLSQKQDKDKAHFLSLIDSLERCLGLFRGKVNILFSMPASPAVAQMIQSKIVATICYILKYLYQNRFYCLTSVLKMCMLEHSVLEFSP